VRGRARTRGQVRLVTAGIERVAAELEREHLQRHVDVEVFALILAALADELEQLGRHLGQQLARLLQVGRLDRLAGGPRGQQRGPQPQGEGPGAGHQRVHGRCAVPRAAG
jgi:hypothetical protein